MFVPLIATLGDFLESNSCQERCWWLCWPRSCTRFTVTPPQLRTVRPFWDPALAHALPSPPPPKKDERISELVASSNSTCPPPNCDCGWSNEEIAALVCGILGGIFLGCLVTSFLVVNLMLLREKRWRQRRPNYLMTTEYATKS